MNELLKALGPVRSRLRLRRFVSGAGWGFAGGALAALILLAVTSFVPLANRWWIAGACVAGGTLLAAASNALRPVSPLEAARAADACGLRERAVTALELAETAARPQAPHPTATDRKEAPHPTATGRPETASVAPAPQAGVSRPEADITLLQRRDACERLQALDARQIRPAFPKRRLLAGTLLLALCAATLLLPGGGDRAVAARQALETKTAAMAKAAEEAEKADEAGLTEKEKAELRKLTADLKRDLTASRDEADALVAVDKAEQQLQKLRQEQAQEKTAGDAMSAMNALSQAMQSAGMDAAADALAEALASGDAAAMSKALSDLGAEDLQRLSESLTGEAKALAEAMARTAQQGELSEARMQALQQAAQSAQSAGSMSAAQQATAQSASSMSAARQAAALQQALAGMKASLGAGQSQQSASQASMSGAGAGSGNNPGQSGGGAGTGSTNEEQKGGSGGQKSGGSKGTNPAEFKQTEYETIYDPEKVDVAARDVMTNQQSLGKDSVQIETGPGKGSLEGNVPVSQVVGEYAEQEVKAAESANLTREQKQWVDEYFRKLTEE